MKLCTLSVGAAGRQGEAATSLFIIISGRVRLVREMPTKRPAVRVEEEVCFWLCSRILQLPPLHVRCAS